MIEHPRPSATRSTPPFPSTSLRTATQRNSYYWVKEQRTLALTRAYMLLKMPDGSVAREDWVRLMECLRPDCNADHVSIPRLGLVFFNTHNGAFLEAFRNGLRRGACACFGFPSVPERGGGQGTS